VFVAKKYGTKILFCDYRKLNQKIIRDSFPMDLIDDVLHKLQKDKVFTTLDLSNGFVYVPWQESSRKYTAFVTKVVNTNSASYHSEFQILLQCLCDTFLQCSSH